MYLSIEYKFLFIHIPKCAGEWLYNKLRYGIHTPRIAYWGLDKENDIDLAHLYQDIVSNYIPAPLYDQYYTFAIVRNPYNRFYSAYKDLLKKMSEYSVWYTKYPLYKTFEEFAKIVDKKAFHNKITRHNIHIVPQHKFILKDNKNNVNHLIKYEEMNTELPKLFDKLKVYYIKSKDYTGRKLHFNDIKLENIKKNYFDFYTPEILEIVNRLYKKDFELLGYKILNNNNLKKNKVTMSRVKKDTINNKLIIAKLKREINLRRNTLINFYSIKYVEDCKTTEIIENVKTNIEFNLQLSEYPPIQGYNKDITSLMYKNNKLYQECTENNVLYHDIFKLTSCYKISEIFHKFNINDPSIIINNFSYYWNIYNFLYYKKYLTNCKHKRIGLRYIRNNLKIAKDNIINSSKYGIQSIVGDYDDSSLNLLFISNNLKIKSDSNIKINYTNIMYKYNLNDSKNLYNLHNLIDKKYNCCNCIENSAGILDLHNRDIIREYVVFQRILNNIMIGYQVLSKNGMLILAFEGSSLEISKQLIYLLSSIFKKVILDNSVIRLNFSSHFYVICEGFAGFNKEIFNNLVECNKQINKVNKTIGERLILKNKDKQKEYHLKLPRLDSVNSNLTDTHFVTNLIDYTPNKEIEKAIENIVLKNYKIANEFLNNIKTFSIFDSKFIQYVKAGQTLIASYILNKYFGLKKIHVNYDNKISTILNAKNVSLIHIPRSGFTGIKLKLWNKCNKKYSISQRNMIFYARKEYYSILSLYHLNAQDYPQTSVKISIVRNPYDRFLSAFNYIKEGGKNNPTFPDAEKSAQRLFQKYNINNPLDIFTADKWLKDKILSMEFFKPQHTYICIGNTVLVDKLFYFEQMESVYKFFNKLLDINIDYKIKLNKTTNNISLSTVEYDYIYNYYKKDFKIFNYKTIINL